ncbi:MAG TPA: hypothetical protein PKC89_03690 [Pyrinomonadaceae bacterium]|nr:hypothetical protein [Pyrinomonadaceae bacterium]
MFFKLEITTIGDSLGVILPKELAERLAVQENGWVAFRETPQGIEVRTLKAKPLDDSAIVDREP